MVVVFWYFCILFYLYFVPFVFCCNCILLHLYFGNLYSVLLYFVVFVFWNFVFCSICILSHLYFVAFVFCYKCILAICILFFCILSCLYFEFFVVFCSVCIMEHLYFDWLPFELPYLYSPDGLYWKHKLQVSKCQWLFPHLHLSLAHKQPQEHSFSCKCIQ